MSDDSPTPYQEAAERLRKSWATPRVWSRLCIGYARDWPCPTSPVDPPEKGAAWAFEQLVREVERLRDRVADLELWRDVHNLARHSLNPEPTLYSTGGNVPTLPLCKVCHTPLTNEYHACGGTPT